METEVWEDIPGWFGEYQASTFGRIRNGTRILKFFLNKGGYNRIKLKSKVHYSIARLVGTMFIPNPENKTQINHKNGIKTDDRATNLEWCTPSENSQHAYDTGLSKVWNKGIIGDKNPLSKKVIQYSLQGDFIREWNSVADIRRILKIHDSGVSRNCQGKIKYTGGFIFKYKTNE